MSLSRLILAGFQESSFRRVFRPVENAVRKVIVRRGRVLFGPMRGLLYESNDVGFFAWSEGSFSRGTLLGTYELPVQRAMVEYLKKGDTFYDVGAFHGYLSLLAARLVGPTGHVFAFEPLPQSAERCRASLNHNGITHYTLVPAAVGDASGQASLYLTEGNDFRPSLIYRRSGRSVTVDTITLDEFARENRPPTVIKVDVEGGESAVLAGARQLLGATPAPTWLIEVHDAKNDEEIQRILSSHGYRLRLLGHHRAKRPYACHYAAWKPPLK